MGWFSRGPNSPDEVPAAEQTPEKVANLVAQCIGLGVEAAGAGG
jgi:hypothetical protein